MLHFPWNTALPYQLGHKRWCEQAINCFIVGYKPLLCFLYLLTVIKLLFDCFKLCRSSFLNTLFFTPDLYNGLVLIYIYIWSNVINMVKIFVPYTNMLTWRQLKEVKESTCEKLDLLNLFRSISILIRWIWKMDLSYLEFGAVHCHFQGHQGNNVKVCLSVKLFQTISRFRSKYISPQAVLRPTFSRPYFKTCMLYNSLLQCKNSHSKKNRPEICMFFGVFFMIKSLHFHP